MDHIARMEQRTHFATDESAACRGHAAVDRAIEEMRRAAVVDAELASLRESRAEAPTAQPAGKPRRTAK